MIAPDRVYPVIVSVDDATPSPAVAGPGEVARGVVVRKGVVLEKECVDGPGRAGTGPRVIPVSPNAAPRVVKYVDADSVGGEIERVVVHNASDVIVEG